MDSTTGRNVALKLIDPSRTSLDAAWREATYLTSLASPNGPNIRFLASVHGAAESDLGVPYIDMVLLAGSVAKKTPPLGVDESLAVEWIQRVSRGLHLCHERRLLHRDVKPDNILLSQTGDALLGDFGVTAVMAADGTAESHGDPDILAPEAFGGRCSVQTDVYSLGVSLYYLVTGGYPFRLSDYAFDFTQFEAVVKMGVPDVREFAPHLSLGIAKVIRIATERDLAQRYQSAEAMDAALASLTSLRRVIREVAPCTADGRCWDAEPQGRLSTRPVHVCATPITDKSFEIETRHVGGNRITAHCVEVKRGQLVPRLRSVFRDLQ